MVLECEVEIMLGNALGVSELLDCIVLSLCVPGHQFTMCLVLYSSP